MKQRLIILIALLVTLIFAVTGSVVYRSINADEEPQFGDCSGKNIEWRGLPGGGPSNPKCYFPPSNISFQSCPAGSSATYYIESTDRGWSNAYLPVCVIGSNNIPSPPNPSQVPSSLPSGNPSADPCVTESGGTLCSSANPSFNPSNLPSGAPSPVASSSTSPSTAPSSSSSVSPSPSPSPSTPPCPAPKLSSNSFLTRFIPTANAQAQQPQPKCKIGLKFTIYPDVKPLSSGSFTVDECPVTQSKPVQINSKGEAIFDLECVDVAKLTSITIKPDIKVSDKKPFYFHSKEDTIAPYKKGDSVKVELTTQQGGAKVGKVDASDAFMLIQASAGDRVLKVTGNGIDEEASLSGTSVIFPKSPNWKKDIRMYTPGKSGQNPLLIIAAKSGSSFVLRVNEGIKKSNGATDYKKIAFATKDFEDGNLYLNISEGEESVFRDGGESARQYLENKRKIAQDQWQKAMGALQGGGANKTGGNFNNPGGGGGGGNPGGGNAGGGSGGGSNPGGGGNTGGSPPEPGPGRDHGSNNSPIGNRPPEPEDPTPMPPQPPGNVCPLTSTGPLAKAGQVLTTAARTIRNVAATIADKVGMPDSIVNSIRPGECPKPWPNPIPDPNPDPDDDFTKWKKHTDTTLGFEFQYPPSRKVETGDIAPNGKQLDVIKDGDDSIWKLQVTTDTVDQAVQKIKDANKEGKIITVTDTQRYGTNGKRVVIIEGTPPSIDSQVASPGQGPVGEIHIVTPGRKDPSKTFVIVQQYSSVSGEFRRTTAIANSFKLLP